MKNRISNALILALWLTAPQLFAAETNNLSNDLQDLVMRINAKLQAGKTNEIDLADNIKEYDALMLKHKGEDSQDVAQIWIAKANLFLQALDKPEKALEIFQQFKQEFPTLQINGNTDQLISALQDMVEKRKIQASLVIGAKFPAFDEKDLEGKPLVLTNYLGKVVLLDFWATWCVPCLMELPQVQKTYEKHHSKDFEIIGVSLDGDREKLETFLKQKKMSWPQYNDGKMWDNKLAAKYAIQAVPATFLLDREGTIIGKSLRGDELEAAVALATSPWIKRQMIYATRNLDQVIRDSVYASLAIVFLAGIGVGVLSRGKRVKKN
jgi:thiol-disulfide isomerase/thioredoxin